MRKLYIAIILGDDEMRILVLGSSGMLGADLFSTLRAGLPDARVIGTVRPGVTMQTGNVEFDVDKHTLDFIENHDYVFNCIGAIKQRREYTWEDFHRLNCLFPEKLARVCALHGVKLVHFSTDCVFDGIKGMYTELDEPNAVDDYGRSKALGESISSMAMVLRTSIVGIEQYSPVSLLSWFLRTQSSVVPGYTKAIYSGVTTTELSSLCLRLVRGGLVSEGLYNIAGPVISKYELLRKVSYIFEVDRQIIPDGSIRVDRSLDDKKFRSTFNFEKKGWDRMLIELREGRFK